VIFLPRRHKGTKKTPGIYKHQTYHINAENIIPNSLFNKVIVSCAKQLRNTQIECFATLTKQDEMPDAVNKPG
jgi:hypothetical protein